MADNHRGQDRAPQPENLDFAAAVPSTVPDRSNAEIASKFADRLGSSPSLNPSLVRYPGPRDY